MSYAISDFWSSRLKGLVRTPSTGMLPGWSMEQASNPSFVEADLNLRSDFDNLAAPIWFVAAPGAVGKSTLAKEISARTSAAYLDLAKADTVAGNYLTGGLVKNRLHDAWQNEKTTVLIDALDEARLRVTQTSFADFLNDIEALTRGRMLPTVLFGRVGIVEEAWLILLEKGVSSPIFDIDFFDNHRSKLFVMAALDRLSGAPKYRRLATSLASHRSVYEGAATTFIKGLENAAPADGARFAGYAPVLEAVATALAEVTNPASVNDEVQDAMQGEILLTLTEQILTREATKLRDQLPSEIPTSVRERLYGPDEQLARLTAVVYGTEAPLSPTDLKPQHLAAYDAAVKDFMPIHPFLDGSSRKASGAVFAAAINAHALFSKSPNIAAAAERHAGNGPNTPNPFLIDFYLDRARRAVDRDEVSFIPPEHVVALYESVRARALAGDVVRLSIEADEDTDQADVEILVSEADEKGSDRRILLRSSQAGVLRFGRQVTGVSIDAPHLDVVVGSGNPVEMIAPVLMNIGRLTFDCPELVVQKGDNTSDSIDTAVAIEAQELVSSKVSGVPLIRDGAELSALWPGVSSYPWSQFASKSTDGNGKDIHGALHSIRRLVLAFRSHSRGRLARFRDKIEHARMTKGDIGTAIRNQMTKDRVLTLEGEMYFLDPSMLGKVVGGTYQDLKLKRFSEKVRQYVSKVANNMKA